MSTAGNLLSRFASLGGCALLLSCAGGHTKELKDQAVANMETVRAAADYDLATQQFDSGNMPLALQAIDNSLKTHPEAPKSHLLRGRIFLEMGPADPALEAFDAGIALSPEDADLHYFRGIALERMDRVEEALATYIEATRLSPNHPEYLIAAMESLTDLGNPEEAILLLGKQPFEVRNHAGVKQVLGHIAQIQHNYDGAIEAFTQAVVLSPEDPVLREDLVRALIAQQRFSDAETHLRAIAGTDHYRRRRDLQHMHAATLIELNQPVEARTILINITRAPGGDADFEAWLRLADIALILEDDALLRRAATRMVGIAPQRHEGHLTHAIWQRHAGDFKGALQTISIAEERAHGDTTPSRLRELVQRDLARQQG